MCIYVAHLSSVATEHTHSHAVLLFYILHVRVYLSLTEEVQCELSNVLTQYLRWLSERGVLCCYHKLTLFVRYRRKI